MKHLIAALCVVSALALAAQAGELKASNSECPKGQCPYATAMKDLTAKYDVNKDGKLTKEEKSAMTAEDKAAFKEAKKAIAKMNSSKDAASCPKDGAGCSKDASACPKGSSTAASTATTK